MDHYDRLGNNVDLANADEGEDERYTPTLPEDDEGFSPEREAMEDEWGAQFGDARRCPRHPHVKTSSDDGMFDADCGECEYESEMAYRESQAPTWGTPVVGSGIVDDMAADAEECPDTVPDSGAVDTLRAPVVNDTSEDDIPF